MDFNLDEAIPVLERTPALLKTLLDELPEDWTRVDEGADTWSPREVVAHLIHGERTDWIPRARIILKQENYRRFDPFDRFRGAEIGAATQRSAGGIRPAAVGQSSDAAWLESQGEGHGADG